MARMQLTEEELQEFREIFNLVDTDQGGARRESELALSVHSGGRAPVELAAQSLLRYGGKATESLALVQVRFRP